MLHESERGALAITLGPQEKNSVSQGKQDNWSPYLELMSLEVEDRL